MKRYIYLLFVFCEKIHEILGLEYSGDQGSWLPFSRENPFVNALRPPDLNFPVILAVNLCFVLYNLATKAIGCRVR